MLIRELNTDQPHARARAMLGEFMPHWTVDAHTSPVTAAANLQAAGEKRGAILAVDLSAWEEELVQAVCEALAGHETLPVVLILQVNAARRPSEAETKADEERLLEVQQAIRSAAAERARGYSGPKRRVETVTLRVTLEEGMRPLTEWDWPTLLDHPLPVEAHPDDPHSRGREAQARERVRAQMLEEFVGFARSGYDALEELVTAANQKELPSWETLRFAQQQQEGLTALLERAQDRERESREWRS